MALEDYGALLRSGAASVPDYAQQAMQRQLMAMKQQEFNAQLSAFNRKQQDDKAFHDDLTQVLADPSATNISSLMLKHPDRAEQIKSSWDLKEKAVQDADLRQMVNVFSAAQAGKYDIAAQAMQERIDADKAVGHVDPTDQAILDGLKSGDPVQQKAAQGMMGAHLAAITGADHFGPAYGALKGGYTLEAGATRYDDQGNEIARSPYLKAADGSILERDGSSAAPQGAPSSVPPGTSPKAAEVASALSSSGLPAPVVAGFMGNFHVEGGYNGAQGDGGSASGIGQWHNDRAANFEKVIGKPVTEATPAEQAKFVSWEMQNPEAAGMTVQQRDAIMNAKTPAQAAALIDKFYERSSGDARQQRMAAATAFASSGASQQQAANTGAPPGYHVLVPGNDPGQYRTLTPAEVKSRGLDASQQYQLNTKTGALTGLGKIDAADQPLPGDETKSGPAYLATIPPNMATQVKALAEGRLPMPSSFALAKPYWQRMLQMTAQYDPTFDAANAPARKAAITAFTGNGKAAQVIGSVNRVANHLDLLWNESKRLAGPETGWSVTNKLLAAGGQAFEPQDAKAYDTEVTFVAGELGKIAKAGVVTEGEVDRIISNLSRTNSTSTREAAIKAAVGIISGAVDPLKDQYNSAFTNGSTRPNIPWVSPRAQQIYHKIGGVDLNLTDANADTNTSESGASGKTVVRTGRDKSGRRVVQYSDGSISYAP